MTVNKKKFIIHYQKLKPNHLNLTLPTPAQQFPFKRPHLPYNNHASIFKSEYYFHQNVKIICPHFT